MAIVDTLSKDDFIRRFLELRPENFSVYALEALFDELEEISEGTGESIEFDPISICCDYTEYHSLEEIQKEYSGIKDLNHLMDNTTVLLCSNSALVIRNF